MVGTFAVQPQVPGDEGQDSESPVLPGHEGGEGEFGVKVEAAGDGIGFRGQVGARLRSLRIPYVPTCGRAASASYATRWTATPLATHMDDLARLYAAKNLQQFGHQRKECSQLVASRHEHNDSDVNGLQSLLILEPLVRRYKRVVARMPDPPQQGPVLHSPPAQFLNRMYLMFEELTAEWPRNTFVKQHTHTRPASLLPVPVLLLPARG